MTATPHVAHLQAKIEKQRQELRRLQRQIETLTAEKAALRFDLHKANARIAQMVEERT